MSDTALLDPPITTTDSLSQWQALRDAGLLLTAPQVAEFVARGVISFPGIVPETINRAVLASLDAGTLITRDMGYRGDPFAARWPDPHPLGHVFRLPAVQGIISSLVGPDPLHDHHAVHTVAGGHLQAQSWHADAAIDPREDAFDIQIMYFPHDTPVEMGGTMVLPGSHLRMVHEYEINCYQHIVGQQPTICPAGTIQVVHHGMWHRARGNRSDQTRTMIKLRLNPTWKQEALFDLSNYDGSEVARTLTKAEPWFGSDHRIEIINRIRLWRHLTGDHAYNLDHWLGRLEARPTRRLQNMA